MLRILVAMALLSGAIAGQSAIVINRADVGTAITVDYAGAILGIPTSGLGALSSFVYTGASTDGRTYNFNYTLNNDSTLTSRVRSFGFDVLGSTAITGLSSTGTYNMTLQNPLSALVGTDICFTAAGIGTCSTGAGGLSAGQTGTGSFALTFADSMASVQLSDFTVNFQGVSGLLAGTGTGDPVVTMPPSTTPVSTAPESSTWAMMMIGFGLIGWLARRRPAPGQPSPFKLSAA